VKNDERVQLDNHVDLCYTVSPFNNTTYTGLYYW